MFPLFLNLSGRLGVVIGGGPVGRRKAQALLDAGSRVRLVCLEARPANAALRPIEWLQERYHPGQLQDAFLVFAAANSDINRQVATDARARGLWVNVADKPAASDFHLPATLRRGNFTVAVATTGASPGLARAVRTLLENQFDDAFGIWVDLLARLRPHVLDRAHDAVHRRALFERLCQWDWLERIRQEGAEAVAQAMKRAIDASGQGPAERIE